MDGGKAMGWYGGKLPTIHALSILYPEKDPESSSHTSV